MGTYHPQFLKLDGEQQYTLLHSGWTKKPLWPVGLCHTDVSFLLGTHMSPKGQCVPIGNRSVKVSTKNKNSGRRRERSQRDAIYWAWLRVLAGSSLPEPDESDSLSVCAGTTVILVLPWVEVASIWQTLLDSECDTLTCLPKPNWLVSF